MTPPHTKSSFVESPVAVCTTLYRGSVRWCSRSRFAASRLFRLRFLQFLSPFWIVGILAAHLITFAATIAERSCTLQQTTTKALSCGTSYILGECPSAGHRPEVVHHLQEMQLHLSQSLTRWKAPATARKFFNSLGILPGGLRSKLRCLWHYGVPDCISRGCYRGCNATEEERLKMLLTTLLRKILTLTMSSMQLCEEVHESAGCRCTQVQPWSNTWAPCCGFASASLWSPWILLRRRKLIHWLIFWASSSLMFQP